MLERGAPCRTTCAPCCKGDAGAAETLNQYLEHPARGLAAVINVLDPDIIVLGGGMSNAERIYRKLPPRLAKPQL
ncbi:ROK family protein [Marinobacter antarcticus]|uniref:ROK family protein n=1 Tax=Marinobacter antarcticus TaxID=564117 RepID=UPI001E652506|nr:ROK family protein [Marinobacter antarcticus]